LHRRFPIVDILFRSGDIRDRSAKSSEIAPKKACFLAPNFFGGFGGGPPIFGLVFKIAPISDHVAKFRGDRPRNRGDLALNKREKRNKQQQNIRAAVALSQRAALISISGLGGHFDIFGCPSTPAVYLRQHGFLVIDLSKRRSNLII